GLSFKVSSGSFFQNNIKQAEQLYRIVEEMCSMEEGGVVYDLYCGTGSFGLAAAKNSKAVYGFEIVESAVKNAAQNARDNEIDNAAFFCGDLSTLLSKNRDLPRPDVAIVDPPRPGMHPDCVKDLIRLRPPRIVYISCNPITQFRDIQLLEKAGYRTEEIAPVDLFPHTPHIETVALLTLRRK
ncbi:S-adenosyl-L-methionine-dependent methyltransferase, partial [Baffinella frigidus]